jgi:hypothetical protein
MTARLLLAMLACVALAGCAARTPPPHCQRVCPANARLLPVSSVLADCCTDAHGHTWSACAWNRVLMKVGEP